MASMIAPILTNSLTAGLPLICRSNTEMTKRNPKSINSITMTAISISMMILRNL